ncbi:hypothetical protein [Leucobacter massiliensis]|uniref:Uncharacterized protein n=1 Tax=Leucobacter massiliensis TaxID=1686285 RepID=A0A2S9QLX7_9MICO|nr:hypothetical protein [Leucobacter massiliensis]PRI10592.1 hypothetical protein B4915_11395 [Leucobacter massiliensis]
MSDTEMRPGPAGEGSASGDELLGRLDLIEAQPLAERAARFERLHEELLAELQRGDHGGS